MTHLKKMKAPKQWHILRKNKKYVVRPFPSGHARELSLPILVVMRDMLHHVQNKRELRIVLRQKGVLVDGKQQKDTHSSMGLFDVLSIPQAKEHYRLLLGENGRLHPVLIDGKEGEIKICKVTGKRKINGGKTQITLHDGHTLIIDKEIKVGDSVVIRLPEKKAEKILKLKKGMYIYLTGGKHAGGHGVLQEVVERSIVVEDSKKNRLETLRKYVTVIGEEKPLVRLGQ